MSPALTATRRYFERRADAIDRFYAVPTTGNHALRRGPWRGRELAVSVMARHLGADVLDLGCGPGRVAEAVIDAGAASYVGIDLSPHMLTLARERLDRFASVELLEGDFLDIDIGRTFDVVLALGLFDYLEEPARAAEWMRARCSSTLLASFTRWDWVKGPIRHFHYELLHRCPIHDYTEPVVEAMLTGAGFSRVEFASRGRRGFFVEATPR
jgi:SAM-dependent methyltransferase